VNTAKNLVAFLIALFASQEKSEPPAAIVENPPIYRRSHTTEDFRRIIVGVLIPSLKQRNIHSFTGSQARKFIQDCVTLTAEDKKLRPNGATYTQERWRSLLSQALRSVSDKGLLYKRPGKSRTYYLS
jgi:hypothetical protein